MYFLLKCSYIVSVTKNVCNFLQFSKTWDCFGVSQVLSTFPNWRVNQFCCREMILCRKLDAKISFLLLPAKDLGPLLVLLQLLHQPTGLCLHGQQLQEGFQTCFPSLSSVARQEKSPGGTFRHGGRQRSATTQRRSWAGFPFIWVLKATQAVHAVRSFFINKPALEWCEHKHMIRKEEYLFKVSKSLTDFKSLKQKHTASHDSSRAA